MEKNKKSYREHRTWEDIIWKYTVINEPHRRHGKQMEDERQNKGKDWSLTIIRIKKAIRTYKKKKSEKCYKIVYKLFSHNKRKQ